MKKKRAYYIVIIISLLIHALLILIIVFYTAHPEQLLSPLSVTNHQPETVFYQEQEPQESLQEWANLKPHASTLGPSMDLEPVEQQVNMQDSDVDVDTADVPPAQDQEIQESVPQEYKEYSTVDYTIPDSAALARDSRFSPEKKTPPSKKSAAKKKEAQKILSTLATHYLEQLNNEGSNLIKTIGGNLDALPTKDQLLYERYLAKLHWCLNNAHAIKQNPSIFKDPLHATMKIYFQLDSQGKMSNFAIHQSSGNPTADAYITELFAYASSSFPPLPSFIKQNPLPLLYTVLINWDQAHYTHFARQ